MKKNKLLAVSGGPDSMFMLHKMKNQKISVAHVNYNFRGDDSISDYKLIKKFCDQKNIPFYYLDVNEEMLQKYNFLKNKQNIARQIRNDFFVDLSKKNNFKKLFIAHNKDDFLETAIIQQERDLKKIKLFYGLEKKTQKPNFLIVRPLLNYWKNDIRIKVVKNKIPFRDDQTNFEPVYYRNKIRIILNKSGLNKKKELFKYFTGLNKSNQQNYKKLKKTFKLWKKKDFELKFFLSQNNDFKYYLVFLFVNDWNYFFKLNNDKIINIIKFIESKKNFNKKFVLNNNFFLMKKNKKLFLSKYE